ncbi:uncharacterized protein LAESUDRAFT_731550 [Laetiporus sulphureus 93-53]|uniref:Uncharacterized protein n=1 Tax=Laetiporus sulphureus 93-53 TaxID=1314785 RepID=A0A165BJK7_9APHY|nr:uncharacterized protein LAESUDRAFT_731550 [Laetiporus sulphureus 93-53]KZT01181.1 hypothetical protein LAESUDRAFT_731550 [Laetiporus sulphureus 93-53]
MYSVDILRDPFKRRISFNEGPLAEQISRTYAHADRVDFFRAQGMWSNSRQFVTCRSGF